MRAVPDGTVRTDSTGTVHPRLRARVTRPKLDKLAGLLNTAYGVDLALVVPDRREPDRTPCLVVHRALRVDDVVVAVSIGYDLDRPTYDVAVFTMTAWFEYGDPFVGRRYYSSARAAGSIFNFIPSHPEIGGLPAI